MKILAIGAHLDDIELACGGTLARAIEKGHQVKMVVMTKSGYKNFDGKIIRTEDEAKSEGISAAKSLGINDLEILDFPIINVPYNSATVESLDKIITSFNPDLIFTHWNHDTHQDHRNTSLATLSAARYKNNIFMYEPFPPSGRSYAPFNPQMYVDITQVMDKKIEALKKHKSQHKKYGDNWIEAANGRARLRGFEIYSKYAETFEVVRYNLDL